MNIVFSWIMASKFHDVFRNQETEIGIQFSVFVLHNNKSFNGQSSVFVSLKDNWI
jgi:hypothetical protein